MSATITATPKIIHNLVVGTSTMITDIRIRLDDECRNGHEDFAITANILELVEDPSFRSKKWHDADGGACHEHIWALRPDLKPFVDLHLCTWEGIPMHCASNAFYWLAGYLDLPYVEYHGGSGNGGKSKEDCLRIFQEHVRCTDAELAELILCRSQDELRIAIEDLGIVERWKAEADAAIKQLEAWTGKTFVSQATRGRWEPVTQQARELAAERKANGYYTPEAIAARDAEKQAAAKAKQRATLIEDNRKAIHKREAELELKLFILDNFPAKLNCIYYSHTNTLSFNWTSTDKLVTQEEFAEISKVFERFESGHFPSGICLEWKAQPKY